MTVAAGEGVAAYGEAVERLKARYGAIPAGERVRIAKRTSNLFRARDRAPAGALDVTAFDGVIDIDAAARTADVGAMTTYETLVDATLAHGLVPLVVPELKTITLGGAVTGLGIESSSWRNGMPHESVLEMDVLTGDGQVVTARPEGEHRDLYHGFPNSYGTLGYALRVRIELEEARPYVHLRHVPFADFATLVRAIGELCAAGVYAGEGVDFIDGCVFSPTESYLTLGSWAEHAPYVSDYTGTGIYYRSIQRRCEDWLTARDYLWRWDPDWFWCSRAFGVQRPWVRGLLGRSGAGRRLLRSDVYWRLVAFERRHHVKAAVDRWRGLPPREYVVQDVEIPLDRLAEFLEGLQRAVPISPLWLCPLRQRDPSAVWELYRLDPSVLYVNVGFWSTVPLEAGMDRAHHNRWVEAEVDRLGGRKSLYSTAFYDEDRFWELYNGPVYRSLKDRYDAPGRLSDLYAKCVGSP